MTVVAWQKMHKNRKKSGSSQKNFRNSEKNWNFWLLRCLIFQKKTSLLLNFFQKLTSLKIVAYKPLLIKKTACMKLLKNDTECK